MAEQNDIAVSQAARARFVANVQLATQQQVNSGLDPVSGLAPGQEHASQQPAPAVDAAKLADINAMQLEIITEGDDKGRRRYQVDSAFREQVERLRFAAMGGEPLEQHPAQQPPKVEPPQGTPAERLAAEVTGKLESGDVIEPSEYAPELFGELSAGYSIADLLPAGFGIGATESAQLRAAKRAGVPESQIRTIVANLVKEQQ